MCFLQGTVDLHAAPLISLNDGQLMTASSNCFSANALSGPGFSNSWGSTQHYVGNGEVVGWCSDLVIWKKNTSLNVFHSWFYPTSTIVMNFSICPLTHKPEHTRTIQNCILGPHLNVSSEKITNHLPSKSPSTLQRLTFGAPRAPPGPGRRRRGARGCRWCVPWGRHRLGNRRRFPKKTARG